MLNLIFFLFILLGLGIIFWLVKQKWPELKKIREQGLEFAQGKKGVLARLRIRQLPLRKFLKKPKSFLVKIYSGLVQGFRLSLSQLKTLKKRLKSLDLGPKRKFWAFPKRAFLRIKGAEVFSQREIKKISRFGTKIFAKMKKKVSEVRPPKEIIAWQKQKTRELLEPDEYLATLLKDREKEKRMKEESKKPKEEEKTKEKIPGKRKVKMTISQESLKQIENKWIDAIIEDPKNIEAYKKLGRLYFNQGKLERAQECFQAAVKLGSSDRKILELLKKTEARLKK